MLHGSFESYFKFIKIRPKLISNSQNLKKNSYNVVGVEARQIGDAVLADQREDGGAAVAADEGLLALF